MAITVGQPNGGRDVARAPWMDADEVAVNLGVTAHTIRRLAREGRSPVVVRRVGGRWRWSRADVERFVAGVEAGPGSAAIPANV